VKVDSREALGSFRGRFELVSLISIHSPLAPLRTIAFRHASAEQEALAALALARQSFASSLIHLPTMPLKMKTATTWLPCCRVVIGGME
jgi:hypothetical protein